LISIGMSDRIIRIAVDTMGGDNAPDVLVEGSIVALYAYPDVRITLVGDKKKTEDSLNRFERSTPPGKSAEFLKSDTLSIRDRIRIVHADEVIEMSDSPAKAIRTKKNSSVVVANKLCRSGEEDAVISAGNTGAAMASSLLYMGRLKGVMRPAILGVLPSKKNTIAVLDLGANPDCKPEHLYQFGVMASIYVSNVLSYSNPRVGLLNIGEERTKGNELTTNAYGLFEKSDLNFIGNVEGRDVFEGIADVVVCDGFVGNVLLKVSESVFNLFTHKLKKKISDKFLTKAAAMILKPVFSEIKLQMTPEDYGGAQLLGVDGVSIICHGNSSPIAIKNAVRVARHLVLEEVNDQIKSEISKKSSERNE
jgi:phosphate acyltransferase